jgi:hypothetical protein
VEIVGPKIWERPMAGMEGHNWGGHAPCVAEGKTRRLRSKGGSFAGREDQRKEGR